MVDFAYCVKCRCQRAISSVEIKTTKNNRRMQTGICNTCGTKVCKFLKMAKTEDKTDEQDEQDETDEEETD